MVELDALLAAQKFGELEARILRASNTSDLVAGMDWGRDQMMKSSVAVSLIQSRLLWAVGSQPNLSDMKTTSGFVLMYAFLVAAADGLKCADVSAQGHGVEGMIFQFMPVTKAVSGFPDELRNKMIDRAVALEAQSGSQRKDDPYLCRHGMAEYGAAIKRQEDAAAGRPVEPAYQPAFLPRDQWEPKQVEARKGFRTFLLTIFSPQQGGKP